METRTRIVLLMHTKEFRYQKCTTGRITCLNLANSEIIPGIRFEDNARFRSLIEDPASLPVLLYPGENAMDVHDGCLRAALDGRDSPGGAGAPPSRRLVVFIVDATWHCSRTIVRLNPSLQRLPRLRISPLAPSRFTIKRQPAPYCLSTLEAAHELFLALESAGLDEYPDKARLLSAFHAMQDYQIRQIRTAAKRPGHAVRGIRKSSSS